MNEAEQLFLAGDYQAAKRAFTRLAGDPTLTPEERELVTARQHALSTDRIPYLFGSITAALVIFAYIASRLGH